jgi:hypothetical protein
VSLGTDRVDALFRCDPHGRLLEINQWDGGLAPRFFLMRTPAGPIRRYRRDLSQTIAARLEALSEDEMPGDPPTEPPAHLADYVSLMPAPVERLWAGPSFALPDDLAAADSCVAVDASNAALLAGGFDDWLADVANRRPFMAVVEAGRAVSICASVRISPRVHCAGVETLAGHRGLGHGARSTRAWAAAVRGLGATACYSTSWDNAASRALAGRLGARLIGVDFHLT